MAAMEKERQTRSNRIDPRLRRAGLLTTVRSASVVGMAIEQLLLKDGDLLFNRTNSPELVGKSAVSHGEEIISFATYRIRVRLDQRVAAANFVNYWINSTWERMWARLGKTDGVGQSNINGSKLALMPIPLPRIEEQRVIVERASRMLGSADLLVRNLERVAELVRQFSQDVLAKAFQGQMVDPVHRG